jgi:CIC family chloride channel protein
MPASIRTRRARLVRAFSVQWYGLARRLGLRSREELTFATLAPAIGIATGVVAMGIAWSITAVQRLFWGGGEHGLLEAAAAAPLWLRIAAPATGGFVVMLLIVIFKQEVRGHGMSGIIEAVALRGGRVAAGPAILREVAGIATVGSGGSLGREGPMIRTGAMLASVIGSAAGLAGRRLKILVGCGAAAGMAAAYNAPVGGALFAMEVILGNFAVEIFGPIVVASVLSTLIARAVRGATAVYQIPPYNLVSAWELFAYLALGLAGGVLSVAFVRAVRSGERLFARIPAVPNWLKPVLGMAVMGAIGAAFPYVYGNGFDTVNLALNEKLTLGLLLFLPLVKVAATAITLGSGCAGGLFTPALFVGALVGGAFGWGVHAVMPAHSAEYGAYALVGMGAITAGTSHAPISSLIVIFEMTGHYEIILPLMLATMASTFVARRLHIHSIYTESLARRGITLPSRLEELVMEAVTVAAVMRRSAMTLEPATPLKAIVEKFLTTRKTHLHVVDEKGAFRGAISLHDLKHTLRESLEGVIAADLMDADFPVIARDERLSRVLAVFAEEEAEELPVVADLATRRYEGVILKRDLLRVYAQEVLGRPARLARLVSREDGAARTDYVELPPGYEVRELEVPPPFAGSRLAELEMPQRFGVWVMALKRVDESGTWHRSLAAADTTLAPEDHFIALGRTVDLDRLAALGREGTGGDGDAARKAG